MRSPTLFTIALPFLTYQASAHGGCLNYTVGDVTYPGSYVWTYQYLETCFEYQDNKRRYEPFDDSSSQDPAPWTVQRKWTSIDPIFDPMNISMACNAPGM